MIRRLIIITAVVAAVITGFGYFVLETGPGLRWTFRRIEHLAPGLQAASLKGKLSGPFTVSDLKYSTPGLSLSLDTLSLDWTPRRLLTGTVHVLSMEADGMRIVTSGDDTPEEPSAGPGEFSLPVGIQIDSADVRHITVMDESTESPFAINGLHMRAGADSKEVKVHTLRISAPMFTLGVDGNVELSGGYPLDIRTGWELYPEGIEPVAGSGSVSGSLRALRMLQETYSPFRARLEGTIADVPGGPKWEASLDIEEFNSSALNGTWPDVMLTASLSGAGTVSTARISGDFTVDDRTYTGALRGSVSLLRDDGRIYLENLLVSVPGKNTSARIRGEYAPSSEWSVSLDGEHLDPAIVFPGWSGDIGLDIDASGTGFDGRQEVRLHMKKLKGRLRGYDVEGTAKGRIRGDAYELHRLDLRSGVSRLNASGTLDEKWDVRWSFDSPDIGSIYPESGGSLNGSGTIEGPRGAPHITASLQGNDINVASYRAAEVFAGIDVDAGGGKDSHIEIRGRNIAAEAGEINTLIVTGSGDRSSHRIVLRADAGNIRSAVELKGSYADRSWEGRLEKADVSLPDFGSWKLREPAAASVSAEGAETGRLCLVNNGAIACIRAGWEKGADVRGSCTVSGLSLSPFGRLLPGEAHLEGSAGGRADITFSRDTLLSGSVNIVMRDASAAGLENEKEIGISIDKAEIASEFDESGFRAELISALSDGGGVSGSVALPPVRLSEDLTGMEIVRGGVRISLRDLGFIPLLVPDVTDTSGRLAADISVSGTIGSPLLSGTASLENGSAESGRLGIRLEHSRISIKSDGKGEITVNGRLESGGGHLEWDGTVHLGREDAYSAEFSLKGADFEAVKTPELRALISPDMSLKIDDHMIDINGELTVPSAHIEPPDLSGAVQPSKDVVIRGEKRSEGAEKNWKVRGTVTLRLGEKVRFEGFGLKGDLTGEVSITETPGRPATGSGEIRIINGTYKAYGQDLQIEKGRLMFVGGTVENPGLDIRAFRRAGDVIAGVNVSGTLRDPFMDLFSEPPMDQADALSYLLLGRPIGQASSSEGNQLVNAASSAGLSGGEFLAKKIGARFGIKDIEIRKGETYEEAVLYMGKYLSPKLYVGYGVGLFEPVNTVRVRYRLNRKWVVQGEHGIESGGDLLFEVER